MWLLLWACQASNPGPAPTDAPVVDTAADPCADLSWETAGAPFSRTWCATCHSSALSGAARAGAPEGVNLESEAQVLALADRVRARALVESPTMPPVGVPPEAERVWFEAWLDCAAPP